MMDSEYDEYDQLEDAALKRLRDADAMSEEETDEEDEDDNKIQFTGRLTSYSGDLF